MAIPSEALRAPRPVLCIGALMVDMVCHVPCLPLSGEGIVASSLSYEVGGCAHNTACAIAELGLPVRLFAPLGSGPYADLLRKRLGSRGFDGFETNAPYDNGACLCMVEPDGERTMLTFPGVDRHYARLWFDAVDPHAYSCAVVSGYEIEPPEGDAIIDFLESSHELPVYLAPGPRIGGISREKIARLNALHAVWHLNKQEALAFTGVRSVEDAARSIGEACKNDVVVTLGAQGALVWSKGKVAQMPSCPVEPVDTVGAGDAHVGAVAALCQLGWDWPEVLEMANQVSRVVCLQQGAALPENSLPALKERVQRFRAARGDCHLAN